MLVLTKIREITNGFISKNTDKRRIKGDNMDDIYFPIYNFSHINLI